MNTMLRHAMSGSAALCIAGFSAPALAAGGGGWDWMIAPYIWAPTISADLNTEVPPSGTDTAFEDIVDKIDGAFLLHVEGQGDRFGAFGDVIYLGLGDEKDRERFRTESDLDARLFELAAVWSPGEDRYRGIDVFGGLRYVDVDLTVEVDPVNPIFDTATVDAGESFADFMVGARYTWALSERWGLTVRGDASFGETDGTWGAGATVQYRMQNGAWLFGYRHLDVSLKPRDNTLDLVLSGIVAGYSFNF